jgi:hypothetical protein
MKSITAMIPTICNLMQIKPPDISNTELLDILIEKSRNIYNINRIEKCLIYAPDAIGLYMYEKYMNMFTGTDEQSVSAIPLLSVYPPKTPVCFASMFTGATPEVHGIRTYERPVLLCDTIFDALVRADRKVAIVATVDSSIDLIFRNRSIDYFSEENDDCAVDRAIYLLNTSHHDFIVVYNQQYDDVMHETQPESKEALEALKKHIDSFNKLKLMYNKHWGRYDRLIAFTPDHGAHISNHDGKGTHGEDIPQDMQVIHFYEIDKSTI